MKALLFLPILIFIMSCNCGSSSSEIPKVEKITDIEDCSLYRIKITPYSSDNLYTTICPERSKTQWQILDGKTQRKIEVETIQK